MAWAASACGGQVLGGADTLVAPPSSPTATVSADPCSIFPADNIWNAPILDAPVHPLSDRYIQAIGLDEPLHPDFGSGQWEGGPIGIPFAAVGTGREQVEVAFEYADESDPGPYPLPADPPIEGGPDSDGDRHVLLLSMDECRLYELYAAYPLSDGTWQAGSGAIFDLRSNLLRPAGWTSADAAGLPIFPGLVRYEEVAAGTLRHALRFTAPRTQRAYVWPARHYASEWVDTDYPPMGQRFRLRADFELEGFSPAVQVILAALKEYGMMLADNGSSWFLSGSPNESWSDEELRELRQVRGRDFEAVDVSTWMVDEDSAQLRR
ncbi:MAG: hypothetical protein A2Z17_03855 [Gammaproteobacteria bacterium RBG_16_66_13]|nr:MAG: hypothetical protein A2Z17_03855 [Gammaproteobacteria bacterium RBG_16_66_13]